MEFNELHSWEVSYREAVALQRELAGRVRLATEPAWAPATVGGVDVSYEKHGALFFAAVVVLRLPDLQLLTTAAAHGRVTFPYVPGLLSFRELPILLEAFRRLPLAPDAVLVDGQGIAHPRRLVLASHLGLWLDLPTVGCAKSRLCGEHSPPGRERGDAVPLTLAGDQVGVVLTTRTGIKPLYISPGHRVDVATAAAVALACSGRYRMPEPTRQAHLLTNRLRREHGEGKT
jgi:deoxyribonuclease V